MKASKRYKGEFVSSAVSLSLFVSSLLYLVIEMNRNVKLEENLTKSKLASEVILSEKLALEKEVKKLKSGLISVKRGYEESNQTLAATFKELEKTELELRKVRNTNFALDRVDKENSDLREMIEDVENELSDCNDLLLKMASAEVENFILHVQDYEQSRKNQINSSAFINDALAEVTNKNGKLTLKGKKVKKVMLATDVPPYAENIKLKVTSPDGREILISESDLSVQRMNPRVESQNASTLNAPSDSTPGNQVKRVEIVWIPRERIGRGIYKLAVLRDSSAIGCLQVKFR